MACKGQLNQYGYILDADLVSIHSQTKNTMLTQYFSSLNDNTKDAFWSGGERNKENGMQWTGKPEVS